MNFNSFKEIVTKTKSEHPIWFGLESDKISIDIDINVAEEKLDIKLPKEYKEFIRVFGGGYFAFSIVYSLEIDSDWNLIDINKQYSSIRKDYILVSENGVGDFYGFKIVNGTCESNIYFYDHEEANWKKTDFLNLFDYLTKYALKSEVKSSEIA